ncbi:BORG1 protein, partial [Piaya cayana]|nr:BORG1 protein [Piaya cayana]
MSAKAPIYLKRGSRKGKKEKLRDVLSSDMISPPLGDFRHTIHVGGRGDMFGDVSFLRGKFHLLPRPESGGFASENCDFASENRDFASENRGFASENRGFGFENRGFGSENRGFGSESRDLAAFAFARAATVSGREPPSPPEASSPLLKNAVSLPLLGGLRAPAPPKPPRLLLDEKPHENSWENQEENHEGPRDASFPPPQASRLASPAANGGAEPTFLPHAGSLLSLHVDLGPSILDDVLRVMEKHRAEGGEVLT